MLKKIRVFDLQVGMHVVDTGLSWVDHPYLYGVEGEIESEEQIRHIRGNGFAECFVETDSDAVRIYDLAEVERALDEAQLADPEEMPSNKSAPLAGELKLAQAIHSRAIAAVKFAMEAVSSGVPMDAQACLDAGRDIASSVTRNRDALICLTRIDDRGDYHIRHGVGVAVLAAAFGEYLNLDRTLVSELAVAGLLHDVGKALSPKDLLAKPSSLTPEEYQRLKRHPIESCSVLSAAMDLSPHVLRAVAEHHERHDGSGYPKGIKAQEQSFLGRILAIADVFDALTQDRPYRKRTLPDKAMSVIFGLRGRDFEAGLLERFIKCLGVYPAGSLVRLSTGEHAFVSESNPASPLRPKLVVAFDEKMAAIHPVRLDLSGREGPAPARPVEVACVVDHRDHGVAALEHLG